MTRFSRMLNPFLLPDFLFPAAHGGLESAAMNWENGRTRDSRGCSGNPIPTHYHDPANPA